MSSAFVRVCGAQVGRATAPAASAGALSRFHVPTGLPHGHTQRHMAPHGTRVAPRQTISYRIRVKTSVCYQCFSIPRAAPYPRVTVDAMFMAIVCALWLPSVPTVPCALAHMEMVHHTGCYARARRRHKAPIKATRTRQRRSAPSYPS